MCGKKYELDDVNAVAEKYTSLLSKEVGDKVKLPIVPNGYLSSWAQYTIRFEDSMTRDQIQVELKEKGIPSMVYYVKPMHQQLAFGISGNYEFECSNTEELCTTVLSLPMHPYLTNEDINQVVDSLAATLK